MRFTQTVKLHENTKREAGKSEEEAQRGVKGREIQAGQVSPVTRLQPQKRRKRKKKKRGFFIEVKTAEEESVTSHFDQKKETQTWKGKEEAPRRGLEPLTFRCPSLSSCLKAERSTN